jgi:hypothetical protein
MDNEIKNVKQLTKRILYLMRKKERTQADKSELKLLGNMLTVHTGGAFKLVVDGETFADGITNKKGR